ncbi:hypothetical protein EYF80_022481 [Liparis tanakae]|uniref:Uncharacterized protein n=1 Tax=Liparis tanakae TaxID=230148 RepID=A0A4Z2HQW7_9TELE|nr:hypothetical protein EYF80_022481 [Liparis tanakae]
MRKNKSMRLKGAAGSKGHRYNDQINKTPPGCHRGNGEGMKRGNGNLTQNIYTQNREHSSGFSSLNRAALRSTPRGR